MKFAQIFGFNLLSLLISGLSVVFCLAQFYASKYQFSVSIAFVRAENKL